MNRGETSLEERQTPMKTEQPGKEPEQIEQQDMSAAQPVDQDDVLDLVMDIGHLLLENGAEIYRVEETIQRVANYYGVDTAHAFILTNGIFVSADNAKGNSFAKVDYIPVKGAQLDRVVAVNQLSREIAAGKYDSIAEAREELRRIRAMKGKPKWAKILGSGLSAACFCLMFGGRFPEALVALCAGLLMYLFILGPGQKMSKIVSIILGSALVSVVCLACYRLRLSDDFSHMIIGSIIPLIPGIPFTNGIRDIANGDYLSGIVRMLDALLGFLCIAIGVGIVMSAYQWIFGGFVL